MRWCVLLLVSVFGSGYCQNCRGNDTRFRDCDLSANLCDKDGNNCKVKAALLLPQNTSYYANLPMVRSVFDLALSDPVIRQALPPGFDMELTPYDVLDCDAAYAVISAIDAYNDCAHVFFGPSCDFGLASVARITKFLGSTGTPVITTGGFTFDFVKPKQTCLDEFYMMVRTGPVGFKDLAYFLIDMMRLHNWEQLLLINDPESQVAVAGKSSCHLMMKTLANFLKIEDILYTPWDVTSDGGLNYTENLKFYVDYKYTSIYGNILVHRYDWRRVKLLFDTPAYLGSVGGNGGHLLASTIHRYMMMEGINVVGTEMLAHQPYKDMLLEEVGNDFASEFRV